MPEDTKKEFPKDFMWGASISAYQSEGGNKTQWSVWEELHADQLAKTAETRFKHLKIWPDIMAQASRRENYINGQGVDHYNRYKEDFDLLQQLNLNAFRFGIEWARLEPTEGVWDQEAIQHYKDYIAALKKRGIEPMLNIWHWTMPTWFTDKGAFEHRRNLKYFYRFVHMVANEFCVDINYVLTINEPNVYASFSYLSGEWPPQEKNMISMLRVYWNLAQAHKKAYYILKHQKPSLQVGLAAHLANIQAKNPHDISDELSTKIMRYGWNWWFLHRVRNEQDFIGINYYFTDYYDGWFKRKSPSMPLNDLGWYMEPEGIYPLLLRAWAHYQKPIIITENGVADMHDEYRRWWIEESIVAMERARSEGVKILGYFHWSLLDNFEWTQGWWPNFGLVSVDRERGMKRTIRPSAKWFADRIKKLS